MSFESKALTTFTSIGTHDGKFHADEALACYLLLKLPAFAGASVTRTRNEEILASLDCIVDVGAKYDADLLRFDHHQADFDCTFSDAFKTKLSSAGLVYKHFGKELIEILGDCKPGTLSQANLELLYVKCYKDYIEGIDAVDNGISATKERPAYTKNSVSSIVDRFNPINDEENPDEQFHKAKNFIGQDFERLVYSLVHKWLPARHVVESALSHAEQWDSLGRILVLHACIPWKLHLLELERERGMDVKYVLFPDTHSGSWRIQAVPASEDDSFLDKMPLPEQWKGKRGAELDAISGIEGCIFVHASRFIGGNLSFEGALAMAKEALKLNSN
jgi:uncharacterized UPF0160 family protein